ncbi:MAG TPA: beta-eliminating lyase, partial [Micavibrio sp.]
GAIEALKNGESFIEEQKRRFKNNAALVWQSFDRIDGISAVRPSASFYAFFKSDREQDCMTFARRLIDDHRLGLAPGCAFGQHFTGYMRLCYAVSEARLEDALGRLERAMK